MKCFICGKYVDPKDDPFEQFVITNTTMCQECKSAYEKKHHTTSQLIGKEGT